MSELEETVSTVGTKTLAAFVALPMAGDAEVRLQKSVRVVMDQDGTTIPPDVARELEQRVSSIAGDFRPLARDGHESGGLIVVGWSDDCSLGRTWTSVTAEEDTEVTSGAASTDAMWLVVGDHVATEADGGEVKARIPILRLRPQENVEEIEIESGPGPAAMDAFDLTVREDLVFHVPTTKYQAIFDKIRERALFLFLGVFAVGTVLSAGLARRFLRPLHQLDVGFKRLSAGDVAVRVDARGRDEMGRLGLAFNEMTRRLRVARERATELMRKEKLSALGRLAAGVAHDVRNPLQSINLTIEHLHDAARPEAPDKQTEFDRSVGLIREEVKRLDRLVGTFLRFARSERGPRQPVSLSDLLRETAALVAKEAERRGIEIAIDAAPLPRIEASEEALKSSLLNLVLNSFEAMPRGGRIELRAASAGDRAVVEVVDDGIGIPEDDLDRVFDFGFTTRENGHGLGLAMVHRVVVEEHGGRVDLKSTPGEGTRIRLELPLSRTVTA
jgi:signal transduction histidine kinase